MIKIYNRSTGEYEVENVAGGKILDLLYGCKAGNLGLELLIKRKFYSSLMGVICNSRFSKGMIKNFIKKFDIDMSLYKGEVQNFKNFNQFFIREMKEKADNYSSAECDILLSPGDGRLKAWSEIDTNKLIQVKSFSYTLKELLVNNSLSSKYEKGTCLILRLAPIDYHRFHFIDEGICSETIKVKGSYYSVNPVALEKISNVFCKNKREYSILHSKNFGDILYVEVGATSVGSIVQTYTPDCAVLRGDEKGYFKFGGSTVILFFEKGAVSIDKEILMQTELGFETKVLAGEPIGKKG